MNCYACERGAEGTCRDCGRPYCPDHGAAYCAGCGRAREARGRPNFSLTAEAGRCALWGALVGFPSLVVGSCIGLSWDGETDANIDPGVLLWPVWLVYRPVVLSGFAPVVVMAFAQWAGYSALACLLRAAFRTLRFAFRGRG